MAQLSTTQSEPDTPETGRKEPSVLVVLVVHDGLPWLRECLRSLSRQTHPRLGIVAVDNGSTDGSGEVLRQALGETRVLTLPRNPGLPAAVKAGLGVEAAERADYVLVLHDDTALEPDAVARLVETAERVDGVGVVGPKVLDWDDPRVLREVGQSTDRFGYPYSPLEEDEIDHGQYDRVREVLFVSSCAMLVSRAAWKRAGPPDERFEPFHEDLDFCWRARLAGFRVLMSPQARARHRGSSIRGDRPGGPRADRARLYGERASLAAMLKNYRLLTLLWLFPLYALQATGKAILYALSRRFEEAWQVVAAWGWNLLHLPGTIRRRIRAQSVRAVPDRAVRRYMAPESVRLRRWLEVASALLRRQETLDEELHGHEPTVDEEDELQLPSIGARTVSLARAHPVGMAWFVFAILGALATRHLVGHDPLTGGALPRFPAAPSGFFHELLSGVRTTALGGTDPGSPALGMLGVLSTVLFGSTALAQKALLILLPPLAGVAMYRTVRRRTGERVPAVLAAACYGLSPLLLWAYSEGRIAMLVLVAAAPALLDRLERAFGPVLGSRPVRFMVGAGLVLAVAVSFAPGAALSFGVMFLAVLLVPGRGGRFRGLPLSIGMAVAGASLAFPALLAAGGGPSPALGSTIGRPDFAALVRLAPGGGPGSWSVALFLPVAALVSFTLVDRERRLAAFRLAVASVAGVYLAWLSAAGYLPAVVSNPTAYLAVAAVADCVLIGLGVAAVIQMGGRSFGYRQVAGVAVAALLGGGVILQAANVAVGEFAIGRSKLPPAWPLVAPAKAPGVGPRFRVLWLGERSGDPFPSPGGDAVATASAGGVTVRYAVAGRDGITALDTGRGFTGDAYPYLEESLGQIFTGSTTHGGTLLGALGVAYVVSRSGDLPEGAATALDAQVDLDLIPAGGLVIYRNDRTLPPAFVTSQPQYGTAADGSGLLAIASLPTFRGTHLASAPGGFRGRIPDGGARALVEEQFDQGWRLTGSGGAEIRPAPAFGWALGFTAPDGGPVRITYERQWVRDVEVGGLAALWLIALWITRKPARRRPV